MYDIYVERRCQGLEDIYCCLQLHHIGYCGKPERLQLAASKLSTSKVKSVTSTFYDTILMNRDVHYCILHNAILAAIFGFGSVNWLTG